ncbi:S-adenosyl-L-methionine-dependent methyltransferase [Clathrospora elynae]|uniref:Mitochondrial transcription factor 1 n=1 Tax=Clathrospora elynae TaxID=706981 RepID=A0A6A5TBW6_9PLEO|nr:S-adenosyl-L-methionine-dependent methyltransferase [Clathrospora elynae]
MFRIHPSTRRIFRRPSTLIRQWSQTRNASSERGRQKTTPTHWTDEKLKTHSEYPLSAAMSKLIHPKHTSLEPKSYIANPSVRTAGVHVRTQIVSPDLCDDVIKYIGHTLDKHKGGDILDINPGAGLWSQKLHAYLQPRSHVLLEPRHEKFGDYLDPLLSAPGSRYALVAKDPCELATYRDMVADGVFPHQRARDSTDASAQAPNNTLLVTGSLVWDPRLPGLGFDSMAKQLFHHFAAAASTNDLFHAFGLVRTLLWVQHDDFGPMIASSINGMQKANRFLEMTHNMNVVVGPECTARKTGRGSTGRDPQYEIESTVRALKAGREKGMELPPHRRDPIHDFAADIATTTNGTGRSTSAAIQEYLRSQHLAGKSATGLLQRAFTEHYEEERSIRNEYPDVNLERPGKKGQPSSARLADFYKKRASVVSLQKKKVDLEAIADIGEEMYKLECDILGMKDGPEKDAAMKELEELDSRWENRLENMVTNYAFAPLSEVDDRIAMRSPPYPRLQWDARPYEPLVMRQTEVWPANRLCLISAEPIPKPHIQSSDWFEWVQDFVFGLYSAPIQGIPQALDRMQHGLSDIIEQCPSLKDPKKGGRLQMKHLRVRTLTMEMIEELVQAYKDWPFKAPGSNHNKYFRNKPAAHLFVGRAGGGG